MTNTARAPLNPLYVVAAIAMAAATLFFILVFFFGCICLIGGAGNPSLPIIATGLVGAAVTTWLTSRAVAATRKPR